MRTNRNKSFWPAILTVLAAIFVPKISADAGTQSVSETHRATLQTKSEPFVSQYVKAARNTANLAEEAEKFATSGNIVMTPAFDNATVRIARPSAALSSSVLKRKTDRFENPTTLYAPDTTFVPRMRSHFAAQERAEAMHFTPRVDKRTGRKVLDVKLGVYYFVHKGVMLLPHWGLQIGDKALHTSEMPYASVVFGQALKNRRKKFVHQPREEANAAMYRLQHNYLWSHKLFTIDATENIDAELWEVIETHMAAFLSHGGDFRSNSCYQYAMDLSRTLAAHFDRKLSRRALVLAPLYASIVNIGGLLRGDYRVAERFGNWYRRNLSRKSVQRIFGGFYHRFARLQREMKRYQPIQIESKISKKE